MPKASRITKKCTRCLRNDRRFPHAGKARLRHRKDVNIMDSKETERIISSVGGTMAMEGLPLTEENKDRLRECLEGRKSFEEYFRDIDERRRK